MSTLLPTSVVRSILERLAGPHGLDRYLELVDPLLVRGEDRAVVTDVRRETADTTTLTLRPNRWAGHAAGQYVRVSVEIDGRRHARCYSVSSSQHRDDGRLTITVKADPQGLVSPYLARHARPGLVVGLSEADGDFVLPAVRPDRLLLISGGSGITPVGSILRTLADEDADTDVTLLHYAPTADDVAFRDELRELHTRRDNVRVVIVLTRDPAGSDLALTGHLTARHVDAVLDDPTDVPTYVCGPVGLVDGATRLWSDAGLADLLHIERFQPAAPAEVDGDATGTITLTASRRRVANDGRPLLAQIEAAGLSPQAGCRMGICHTCIKPKLVGRVRDVRDGRVSSCDPEDIQICINAPVGDVTLEI
ncbi:MAG TPA: FAD-binding oxidoreductase [Nitriliruptorales bacterium]